MATAYTDVVFNTQQPDQPTATKLNKLTRDLSAAIAAGGGGTGTGDMTKAIYDTDNNGKVDTADSIPWTGVTGKPTTFPAAVHATTHLDNGSDPVPVVTVSRTGLAPILSSDANTYLNGSGTWSTPQTLTQAQWNYRNILTIADPGNGNLRFDNALAGSATQIAISRTTANNVDRYNLLKSLQVGDTIQVQDTTASANWIRYRLTAVPTDNASWFLLAIATVIGSGTTPGNNDLLTLSFSIAGGGGPTGDMLKSVYDTNANNKVDSAESADSVPWTGVTGKPATFPATAHGSTHLDNGSDVVPVVTITRTGLAPKLSGDSSTFLNGNGAFTSPTTQAAIPGILFKSAAYTVTTADQNKYIICSGGSWTLTLPAAAAGLCYNLRNDMGISGTTGTITVSPPSGTIDGLVSLALLPQQECTIVCDGTNWRSLGLKREVILGTQDITSSTATGSVLLPAGYRHFELVWTGLQPVTANDQLRGVLSSNGGSTWLTGAVYLNGLFFPQTATTVAYQFTNTDTFMRLSGHNTSTGIARTLIHPGSASRQPYFISDSGGYNNVIPVVASWRSQGFYNALVAINALQYSFSTGNIANSFLTVKGVV